MQTTGERLKYLIESQGYNNTTFGEKVGIDNKSVSEITRNKRNLGGVLLKRIAEIMPEVNLNWLFSGIGDMYIGKNADYTNLPIDDKLINKNVETDLFVDAVLKCLDRESVQEKIRQILKR